MAYNYEPFDNAGRQCWRVTSPEWLIRKLQNTHTNIFFSEKALHDGVKSFYSCDPNKSINELVAGVADTTTAIKNSSFCKRCSALICFPAMVAALFILALLGAVLDLLIFVFTFHYCCGKCKEYNCKENSFLMKAIDCLKRYVIKTCCCC